MKPILTLPTNDTTVRPRRANERKLPPGSLRLPQLPPLQTEAAPRVPILSPRPAVQPSVELEEEPPVMRPKLLIPGAVGAEPSATYTQPLMAAMGEPPAVTRPRLVAPGAPPAVEPPAFELPATRPRLTQPVDEMMKLTEYGDELRRAPVAEENGRWKSGLLGMLATAGQASQQMLASGRPINGSSLGVALGGALGGLAGGAINPVWDEKQERERQIGKNQLDISRLIMQRKAQADIAGQEAETKLKRAQAGEFAARPGIKQAEAEAEAREKAISRLVQQYTTMGEYNPQKHAVLTAEAERLGVPLQPYRKGEPPKPTRYERMGREYEYYIDESGQGRSRPVLDVAGQPTAANPNQVPDPKTGLLPGQAANAAAVQGRFEYQQGKDDVAQADKNADREEKRITEARNLITKANETRSKGDAAKTKRERIALYAEAERLYGLVSASHPDLIEHDEKGWPTTLKPQSKRPPLTIPRPNPQGRSSKYVPPKHSKAELEELFK